MKRKIDELNRTLSKKITFINTIYRNCISHFAITSFIFLLCLLFSSCKSQEGLQKIEITFEITKDRTWLRQNSLDCDELLNQIEHYNFFYCFIIREKKVLRKIVERLNCNHEISSFKGVGADLVCLLYLDNGRVDTLCLGQPWRQMRYRGNYYLSDTILVRAIIEKLPKIEKERMEIMLLSKPNLEDYK
jgi:hypothetical protein